LIGYLPGVFGSISLFFLGEGDLIPAMIILTLAGTGFSAGLFLGPAMQADVIDYDELHTGKRREAQYSALWSIMTKFMVIPSMSVPLAILASVGYTPNVEQSETVQFTIRAIFCLGPAATALIAFSIGWFYPLTRAKHEEIWQGIAAHKRGETVLDPITGHPVLPPQSRGIDESIGWELDHFSLSELRQLSKDGRHALRKRTIGLFVGSVVMTVLVGTWLGNEVSFEREPGLLAVLLVVALGIGFTSTVYHFVRFRKISSMVLPQNDIVRKHIETTDNMINGMQTG